MEECYVCGRKSELKHLGKGICKKCFLGTIEKRVKKHLGRKLFKRNNKVLVIGKLEKELLEKAVRGMPLKITSRKKLPAKVEEFDWIVIGKTMDDFTEEFLSSLFKGRIFLGKMKKKFFNILEVLTDEEAKQYAKLKRIRFKVKKKEEFLDTLKEFKEVKYNLYKNVKELRKIKKEERFFW